MKKITVLLLSLVLVFALAACKPKVEVNHPPVINGVNEEVTININDPYDPLDGVYAIDTEDGDLTSGLTVVGDYDNTTQGNYTFAISVTDSDEETTTKSVTLTVEDPYSDNESPVLSGVTFYLFVYGETFDSAASNIGITALDAEDGDLSASIVVDEGDLDLTTAGTYFVTYTVTDSLGVSSSLVLAVKVLPEGVSNPRDTRSGASDTLIVGTSEMNGNFITGFGSSAYDNYVIDLTNGAGVIATTKGGNFQINETVVESYTAVYEDVAENPNLTYTFNIKAGMKFSDGTAITAEDYVFSAKLYASLVYKDAGATSSYLNVVGYEEWNEGCYFTGYKLPANKEEAAASLTFDDNGGAIIDVTEWSVDADPAHSEPVSFYPDVTDAWGDPIEFSPTSLGCDTSHDYSTTPLDFAGVQLIDEDSFSITLKGNTLPYFYLLSRVAVNPLPKDIYTEDGAYDFLNKDELAALASDATHLGYHIKSEYLNTPTISTGAYKFVEYIPGTHAQLELNENYVGDYRGHKATIQNLYIRVVPSATDIEHLLNGEIDILPGVVEGDKIVRARAEGYITPVTFLRNGYGMIAFATDFGPVADYRVRQALAYLIDRDTFVDAFLQGWGSTVDGPYGLGQWMYQDSPFSDEGDDTLIHYAVDLAQAASLLDAAGWAFQSDGTTAYVQGTDTVRYNADGDMLEINWLGTISEYSDLLGPILIDGFSKAGVKLNAVQQPFSVLLENYYYAYTLPEADRQYHMFNLATTFNIAFDPYGSYHTDWLGTWQNSNQFADTAAAPQVPLDATYTITVGDFTVNGEKSIDELTILMRELEPDQTDEFQAYWEMFIIRMNLLLPNIPLYSNQYHHFANSSIKGFEASVFWDWVASVVDMTIGAPAA
jgi:peptide/nickel transport system substrate-binding protein